MVTEQETLIYIEDQDKKDASVAANSFAHKDTKNRAYINTLGAELALKYLASENIDVSDVYNIHSIKKILEELDISDIMLPNIHIDVRVVFDENVIFIPKSHFEYNIEPDIYLVFNLAKDFSHVKFLGFFEPRLINKNNANDKYYFIEKEKLNSALDLKKYIETHRGNTKETLSQEDIENSERIIIAMADNDISENDKKFLIKQLTKSAELRDKFIEYENFETLSYKAMTDPQITRKEIIDSEPTNISDISILDEFENINNTQVDENINEENNKETSENIEELENENLTSINEVAELNLEPIEDIEDISFEDNSKNENNSSSTINNTNTPLEDIGSTIIEGIAGGAAAAAAGEIINAASTADTALNIADTALNIVDSGIEIAKDIITNDEPKETESISFENIDTSAIDNIQTTDENIEEETISLGDVKLPEETENTDFIDQIDNKISFDDIENNNVLEEPIPFNMDEEKISLDEIDTSNLIESKDDNFETETFSFDNIDTSNMENSADIDTSAIDNTISFDDINIDGNNEGINQPDINLENETLSFDNIDTSDIENFTNINDQEIENKISFDDIQETSENKNLTQDNEISNDTMASFDDIQLDNISEKSSDNEQNLNENNIDINDFMDDSISLEDVPSEKIESLDNINEINDTNNDLNDNFVENLNDDNELNDNIDFDNLSDIETETLDNSIEPEIVENTEEHSNESFGKNLLENLSTENIDNISIEDLGIDENIPHDNEDISSNDLLSQIDDILNSTPTQETTDNENKTQNEFENIGTQENETSFDDIPDISDLATISEIEDALNNNPDNTDSLEPINQMQEETESGLLTEEDLNTNDQLLNSSEDTTIDDLLNFDDNTNPHSEEDQPLSDEDNIGVLFNDTDPTSDVELDEINANNQEIQQPQIPGAALLNNQNKAPNKKTILVAAALVTVLAAASAVMVFKPKNDTTADIEPEPIKTESPENNIKDTNSDNKIADESTENILATNAPEITKNKTQNIQKSQQISELKNTPIKAKQTSESYVSVNKLVWDVPSNLSYSTKFQNYLRTAGKSIKLSLSADLLLATEYAYTNQVKVAIKMTKTGNVQDAKIAASSGSTQIDNIVLQSVKDTLNVVKPPVDEIKTPDFNLSLIIYF